MLRTVLNTSWKQHPTKQQLHGHLTPILQTIQNDQDIMSTIGDVRTNSKATFSHGLLNIDIPVLTDQQKLKFISFIRTRGAVKRTDLERWPIGTDDERDSKESDHDERLVSFIITRPTFCCLNNVRKFTCKY